MPYKGGNRNQTTKDHMIMIRSCMAEFPGSIVEHQIGETRLKNTGREALGQATYRPKHNSIDNLLSLWVIMKESRLKEVGLSLLKKTSNTIQRVKLKTQITNTIESHSYEIKDNPT